MPPGVLQSRHVSEGVAAQTLAILELVFWGGAASLGFDGSRGALTELGGKGAIALEELNCLELSEYSSCCTVVNVTIQPAPAAAAA